MELGLLFNINACLSSQTVSYLDRGRKTTGHDIKIEL